MLMRALTLVSLPPADSDLGRLVRAETRAVHCRTRRRGRTPPRSPFPGDGDERVIGWERVSGAADHRGPGRDVAHNPRAPPSRACVGIGAVQRERRVERRLTAADVDVDGPGRRPEPRPKAEEEAEEEEEEKEEEKEEAKEESHDRPGHPGDRP